MAIVSTCRLSLFQQHSRRTLLDTRFAKGRPSSRCRRTLVLAIHQAHRIGARKTHHADTITVPEAVNGVSSVCSLTTRRGNQANRARLHLHRPNHRQMLLFQRRLLSSRPAQRSRAGCLPVQTLSSQGLQATMTMMSGKTSCLHHNLFSIPLRS